MPTETTHPNPVVHSPNLLLNTIGSNECVVRQLKDNDDERVPTLGGSRRGQVTQLVEAMHSRPTAIDSLQAFFCVVPVLCHMLIVCLHRLSSRCMVVREIRMQVGVARAPRDYRLLVSVLRDLKKTPYAQNNK